MIQLLSEPVEVQLFVRAPLSLEIFTLEELLEYFEPMTSPVPGFPGYHPIRELLLSIRK